jgi:hypothetical protein
MKWLRAAVLAALALASAMPAQAEGWKHEFAPYLWGAAMDGTTGIGGVTADVDMSFADILDQLEMGFMGTYRATKDRYVLNFDAIYMGLGTTERGPHGQLKADIDMDQTALEADAGYEVADNLVVFGGLRYVDLSGKVAAQGPLGVERSGHGGADWVDPVVGLMYTIPFSDEWSSTLRGDIGGFGIGSDFAWQLAATLRWQVSPSVGVVGAYRYIAMDYETGKDASYFKYDVAITGPALGVVFTF